MSERPSVRTLSGSLQDGSRSAVDLAEAALSRAERLNPALRCFITIAREEALLRADEADARRREGRSRGDLDGIPYGAKDMFETRGIRTTGGSRVLEDHIPATSAGAIQSLEDAGAVLLGKTNLHEFAYGATGENAWSGTTLNPYDVKRLAGGSSGGSAASVAAGIVPFALGTDTGGSVRVPAALCGVVGFKPSFGAISLDGVIPYCWSLDHAGLMTTTIDDMSLLARHLAPLENVGAKPSRLRVGLVHGWDERCETGVRDAFHQAKAAFREMGGEFIDVELPDQDEARTVSLTVQLAETLAYHGPNLARAREKFGEDLLGGFVLGQFLSAESYVQCKRMLEVYGRAFSRIMATVDVLLTPACPVTAPEVGKIDIEVGGRSLPVGNALTLFTSFFNLVGAPALSLPVPREDRGLPVAVQLVAARTRDGQLLAAAAQLEQQLGAMQGLGLTQ